MLDPPPPGGRSHVPLLLSPDLKREDVPVGTEVWSIENVSAE
jgi:hypothetical protein